MHQWNRQYTYIAVAIVKLIQNSSQLWTKVCYRNQKNGTYKGATEAKVEQYWCKILFAYKNDSQ